MKCPHCLVSFHDNQTEQLLGEDRTSKWTLIRRICPACERYIISLFENYRPYGPYNGERYYHNSRELMCHPKSTARSPLPACVESPFRDDYLEACATLVDSPKASAALSRRCLQAILREKAMTTKKDLAPQIQEVIDSGKLPSHIAESLDAIRNIGNFAAHPIKSTSTGEIIEVEEGEAEWNLDVLEALFDFYFVQPDILKRRKAALNEKLKKAGKPEMK